MRSFYESLGNAKIDGITFEMGLPLQLSGIHLLGRVGACCVMVASITNPLLVFGDHDETLSGARNVSLCLVVMVVRPGLVQSCLQYEQIFCRPSLKIHILHVSLTNICGH